MNKQCEMVPADHSKHCGMRGTESIDLQRWNSFEKSIELGKFFKCKKVKEILP